MCPLPLNNLYNLKSVIMSEPSKKKPRITEDVCAHHLHLDLLLTYSSSILSGNLHTGRILHKPVLQYCKHRPTEYLLEPQDRLQLRELPLRARQPIGYSVEDNRRHHTQSELCNSVAMLHSHLEETGEEAKSCNARLPGMV